VLGAGVVDAVFFNSDIARTDSGESRPTSSAASAAIIREVASVRTINPAVQTGRESMG